MADIYDKDEVSSAAAGSIIYVMTDPSGSPGDGWMSLLTLLTKAQLIGGLERSADPDAPGEGYFVIWMSDGTGLGDDGDVMIASTAGGSTKYGTLFDFSGGSAWPA